MRQKKGSLTGRQSSGHHCCQKKKGMKINEESLRDYWYNIKYANICIIGVPEEEREKGPEKIFEEIIAEK